MNRMTHRFNRGNHRREQEILCCAQNDISSVAICCNVIPNRARNLFLLIVSIIIFTRFEGFAATVEATVKSLSGKVEFSAPGASKFESLKNGQTLSVGSTIKTGSDGVALLLTVPGAAVRIGPDSQMTLKEMDFEKSGEKITKRKALLDVKTGTVSALIEHNTPDVTDFRIKTPQGIAAARGTFYGVTVEDGKSHVAVQEGKVGIQIFKPDSDSTGSESAK
jgi:hypothetical protein